MVGLVFDYVMKVYFGFIMGALFVELYCVSIDIFGVTRTSGKKCGKQNKTEKQRNASRVFDFCSCAYHYCEYAIKSKPIVHKRIYMDKEQIDSSQGLNGV